MIRLGRILLVLVLASLLAAVAAAWLLPVDGGRFRAAIERAASRRLGATVRIDGPIVLRLLPTPTLQAATLRLALPGGGGDAESLRLQVALGPLLAGRLAPRDLVLRRPRIRLPWPPPLPERLPAPEFSARVRDGALTLGSLTLTGLDASLATDPQTGTATLGGTLRLAGQPWRASASLSRRGGDGAAGLRVTLEGGAAGFAAGLSGQLAADGTLSGRLAAHGGDLSQVLPAPAVAFAADGRVTAAAGLVSIADLSAEIDATPVHGAVALRLLPRPRLDVTMATARLDLDQWLAPVHGGDPLLGSLPLGVALSADAATLSGGTLRALRASLDSDGSGVGLRQVDAVLPGEAPLRLAGRIARDVAGRVRFDGDAQLAAADFARTRSWLAQAGVLPPGVFPAGALRTLDLAASVSLDGGRLRLDRMRGHADGGAVAGRLAVRQAAGGRPAIAAALQLDRLDLDRWLPRAWPDGTAPPFDFDLNLDSGTANLRGIALGHLHAEAGEADGDVTLRRFDATAAGGRLAASGSLSASGRLSEARLALDLPRAGPLDGSLPAELRALPVSLRLAASGRPAALSAQIDATLGDLAVTAAPRLDLSGGWDKANWHGPIRLRAPSARAWLAAAGLGDFAWLGEGSLGVTADLAASPSLVALGAFQASLGGLRGGGALQLDLTGAEPALGGRVVADRLPLPGLPRRREAPLAFGGLSGWRAALHVEAGSVVLPDLPALTQASGELALAAGSLRLTGLRAQLAGGALTGMAELATAPQPPRLRLQLALAAAELGGPLTGMPVDLVAGRLDGTAALDASGHSVAALLATARGPLRLDVRDGVLAGIAAGGLPPELPDSAVAAALSGGRTAALRGSIAMQVGSGALAITGAQLAAPGLALGLDGSVDIAAATANLLWSARPDLPGGPEFDLRLAGALPDLGRSPELAKLARWRVGQLPR